MLYVNIKITREGASATQKAELIKGVTQLLQDVQAKPSPTTVVVIDEVETDNWGIGGETHSPQKKGAMSLLPSGWPFRAGTLETGRRSEPRQGWRRSDWPRS